MIPWSSEGEDPIDYLINLVFAIAYAVACCVDWAWAKYRKTSSGCKKW